MSLFDISDSDHLHEECGIFGIPSEGFDDIKVTLDELGLEEISDADDMVFLLLRNSHYVKSRSLNQNSKLSFVYSDEFDSQKRELESALLQMSKLSGTISTQLQELSRLREVSRAAQLIGTKLKKFH